jgi:hypothetical protein
MGKSCWFHSAWLGGAFASDPLGQVASDLARRGETLTAWTKAELAEAVDPVRQFRRKQATVAGHLFRRPLKFV